MRIYLSRKMGSGTDNDPYRPAIADLQLSGWSCIDNNTWMLVKTNNTQEEHDLLLSSEDVIYCPIESEKGQELGLAYPVSDISDTNMAIITNQVNNLLGISDTGITPEMSIGEALGIIIDRVMNGSV